MIMFALSHKHLPADVHPSFVHRIEDAADRKISGGALWHPKVLIGRYTCRWKIKTLGCQSATLKLEISSIPLSKIFPLTIFWLGGFVPALVFMEREPSSKSSCHPAHATQ